MSSTIASGGALKEAFRRPGEARHQNRVDRLCPVPPGRRLQTGIVAAIGVVVQILVTRRDPEHPLEHHVHHGMATLAPLSRIARSPRHRRRQTAPAVRLAQQQRTPVAGRRTTIETRRDTATKTGWK